MDLDSMIFNVVYNSCRRLGGIFGYGAFEGLVMYSSLILLAIIKVTEKKVKR